MLDINGGFTKALLQNQKEEIKVQEEETKIEEEEKSAGTWGHISNLSDQTNLKSETDLDIEK